MERAKRLPFSTSVIGNLNLALRVEPRKESTVDDFEEISLFAEDQFLVLCHDEVFAGLWIRPQSCPICLVGGEAFEGDQAREGPSQKTLTAQEVLVNGNSGRLAWGIDQS